MTWINYLLIYWLVCDVIVISVRACTKNKKEKSERITLKQTLILVFAPPFVILLLPFVSIGFLIGEMMKKWKCKREGNRLKKKLGLRPDENYRCFSHLGGVGVIKCGDCGYHEKITCFTHGFSSCNIGRQCPNCHTFFTECDESKRFHTFGEAEKDCICPKCGTVVRKKNESILKGNDDPLFCPQCHSARLHYFPLYNT